jgi:predicted DNA-binding transcriptional regulator YafY
MPDHNRKATRSPLPVRIEPEPNPEEAAAIVAALEALSEEGQQDTASLKRSRWRLAGLLGHALEPGKEPDGSLWAYSRWED